MFFSLDSSGKPNLTAHHKQTLGQQTIDPAGPGSILNDFAGLLDFIGSDRIKVSKKNHLLPMRSLAALNAQLTHPIELGLKRPRQMSYPHLNGLYLLLRVTGIAHIEGTVSQPCLILDDEILSMWTDLNPTERYFSLLEAWLMRSNPDILGESSRFFSALHHVNIWANFFRSIANQSLDTAWSDDDPPYVRYYLGLYNLGLLELFGLISVRRGVPQPGKGWRIDGVARTLFGEALLALLLDHTSENHDAFLQYAIGDEMDVPIGVLQPAIQPYFPAWQNSLIVPESEFQDGLYIFKVHLGRTWRQIAIPGSLSLEELSDTILKAYAFDHDHLYQFTYVNRFGAVKEINHPYMDESPWAPDVLIGDLGLKPGVTMGYWYDFGDDWRFALTLERIDSVGAEVAQASILKEYGEAPEQYPIWDE